ncbi:hypothetical protein VTN00DRAFT_1343 [Thermoascus crustaceus]|uniref:uncharacterized protein n=1 Tax=Thermoascus crustaceus TaxID=5088 RepID=UPI0037446536
MEMDLQKTKEARRDTPSKQEESSEYRLETYGGNGNSKNFPKNDTLDRPHESHNDELSTEVNEGCQTTTVSHDNGSYHPSPCSSSPQSEAHARRQEAVIVPDGLGLNRRSLNLLRFAKQQPPVTKRTLSELDLPRIMTNINLRMDANFDRDLHFKPDLDGEKGRKKRKEAAEYWEAMAIEIWIYAFCASKNLDISQEQNRNCGQMAFAPRLPEMFETLQDVLKTLVPERDHPSVTQNLDVSLLMQQIRKGVLDLVGLSTWLAGLLKTHCAPMRDEWADQMVEQISSGFHAQDVGKIVEGLQMLFGILEAMKLDVANHQIRAFRVLLIEDTVPFLQQYFLKRMNDPGVETSRNWYLGLRREALLQLPKDSEVDSFWPLEIMFRGLFGLLLQFDNPVHFPGTFCVGDSGRRLWQMRFELQNMINLDICWCIFETYLRKQNRYLSLPAVTYSNFRSRILSLLEENEDCYDSRWLKTRSSVSLEIARFACAACRGDDAVSDDVLSDIERQLGSCLSNESRPFHYFQEPLLEKLENTTFAYAKKYLYMSPLAICESQLPRQFGYEPPISQRHIELEGIAMRLAHIGVLHWRVWAPILYLRDEISGAAAMDQNPDTTDSEMEMAARLSS